MEAFSLQPGLENRNNKARMKVGACASMLVTLSVEA
jgi:hypothetical protein